MMDYGKLLTRVLPWIGAAATGNVPGLITLAAKEVSGALGYDVPATPDAMSEAVANATPAQLDALREREQTFQLRMQEMGFQSAKDLASIALEEAKVYVGDTSDARHVFSGDNKVFWMGIGVLGIFGVLMFSVILGCFLLMTGYFRVDPNVAAITAGLIGTVVGYVASNAQQVVSYFFGSSKGSKDSGQAIGEALTESIKQAGAK